MRRRHWRNTKRPGPGERARARTPLPSGSPADTPLGPIDTAARWAYIQDFDTGATLLEKQADDEMPPSSMTKLMTMYLVYDQLKQGRLKLDDELPVTEKAWRMQGSKMFVQIGSTVKVEDLIRGVIVQSGNDAAIVLAEAIGGSEEGFAEKMNAKAKELGLTHSFFKNCTGWPDPEQHMSARDIATLAGGIIRDFPEYYHYDAEKIIPLQRHRPGQPQSDGAEGHRGRPEDRPYRRRRLRTCRKFKAQRPPGDPGAERHDLDARARRGSPSA